MVGLGGAIGSMARYACSLIVITSGKFPLATFIVNMIGCLLIGLLFGLAMKQQWLQSDKWLILATGFCGGFTTFSAFALENVKLSGEGNSLLALCYTAVSLILGIVLCKAGIALVQ